MPHDFSLYSGERQVATRYEEIRADHRYRYEWALQFLTGPGYGLDVFCGNGYGTYLLGKEHTVWGIDGSEEAINLANHHYKTARTFFSHSIYPFDLPKETFDFVISLESVEHVEDGKSFLDTLSQSLKPGGILIFSTPCEDRLPLAGTGNHFHYKHYSLSETLGLPDKLGLELLQWAGQDCYTLVDGKQGPLIAVSEMGLTNEQIGQFVIVAARKKRAPLLTAMMKCFNS